MLISSKYNGSCASCGERYSIGDLISWQRGERAKHAACSEEGRKAAANQMASRAADADIELVCPSGKAYMPFQKAGIAFCLRRDRDGVLLGDEQGLGKTVQILGWINNAPAIDSVLVVCPKSLALNWLREFRTWNTRDDMRAGQNFVVVTYEEAKKRQAALTRPWGLLVVDEGHYCKNEKAQRTKCIRALMEKAQRRAMLTGTPIPNRPIEIFPLLSMVDPAEWNRNGKGFFPFALRYAGAYQSNFGWDMSGASNLEELQTRMRSGCLIRRKKSEVLTELPAKLRQVIEVPANGSSAAVEAEKAAWSKIEERLEGLRAAVELAKASDDPEDFASAVKTLNKATATAFVEISKQRHRVALAKVPVAIEHATTILEDDVSKKLLIWVHHHDVGDAIRDGLKDFGVVSIDGRTSAEDRDRAVQRFQTDPNVRVFVGGISAAGVGLTLTASDHEVFVELDWVPGNMAQAEDRAHRIGQKNSVLVQYLVLEGSLDARMANVLVDKLAIADAALDLAPAERQQAILPMAQPATAGSVAELNKLAQGLDAATVAAIHLALRQLAGVCDGAQQLDGAGFSRIDAQIGHSLANAARLTLKMAALGLRLCRKYRRQLGPGPWAKEAV